MSRNDGGPAFPCQHEGSTRSDAAGINIRDYFAAKAMHGILAGDHPITHESDCIEKVSAAAYKFSDAMLAEREK